MTQSSDLNSLECRPCSIETKGDEFQDGVAMNDTECTTSWPAQDAERLSLSGTTRDSGRVTRWPKDRSFGFTTQNDGGEDVYISWKQLIGTKALKQGSLIRDER